MPEWQTIILLASDIFYKKNTFEAPFCENEQQFFTPKVVHFAPEWVVHFHRN